MNFAHLNIQTNYAMNGSNIRIDELVQTAVSYGYSCLAITDPHLYGAVKFYKACNKHNVKPLIGLRLEVEGLFPESTNTLLVYAKNQTGYYNLLKLASISSQRPLTFTELKQRKQGIIGIVVADQSELYGAYQNQQKQVIHEFITWLNTHLEEGYLGLSSDMEFNTYMNGKVPLVAIPPVRYMHSEDRDVMNVLRQIFNVQSQDVLGHVTDASFTKLEDVQHQFRGFEEAIEAAYNIAQSCAIELDFNTTHLPAYPLQQEVSAKDYLYALAHKGLTKRLHQQSVDKNRYVDRLNYELSVIDSMGYNDYFLIVWDFVRYAKQQGVLVGPGRGSAAASLVSYCLGITNVDSLEYNLVFERFLNPERITLPDIDMDLPDDKRDDIIRYVRDLYGMNNVSMICTFGTFLSKSAIRDTARILGVEGILLNQIIKETTNFSNINHMMSESSVIQNMMTQSSQAEELLTIASKIEGLHRHVSTHAAGIIVTGDDITNHTAVQPGLLDMFQTQYEAKDLESLGLLKIDFLGLRNLTSIDRIVSMIQEETNEVIDIYKIPLDDAKTYELLRRVETTGIFQLESKGMRRLIGDMQMVEFEDIVTVLALFRPGPMDNISTYIKRRFKEETVTYPHPILEDILEPTNGIIIYQEQIIQIASAFAGYSLGEADLLRRAVSKKNLATLEQERANFIRKATAKGRDLSSSNEIYDYIVKFANYGFNRAHSVAYAMVSYWMAYLKANYPKYFISVLTSSVIGSESQMREYVFESNKLGVKIVKPSVNYSTAIFQPEGDTLRFPLLGIKHLGQNTIRDLLEERKNGVFTSFFDFIKRTQGILNKRVVESLIYAGALDEFGYSKKAMIDQLEEVVHFSTYGDFIGQDDFIIRDIDEYPYDELEELEKSVIGFNLFINPLLNHQDYITKHNLLVPSTITAEHLDTEVRFVGVLTSVRQITTKRNQQMAFVTLQDEYVKLSGVLFSRTYQQVQDILVKGHVFLCKGTVEERKAERQVIITNLHDLSNKNA